MRNFLAHEYFTRESDIIWETVKLGVGDLAAACTVELARLGFAGHQSETPVSPAEEEG